MIAQGWLDHCRMGQEARRPGLLYPPRRFSTQASVRDRRFGVYIHLRILRRKLEGADDRRGGDQVRQGRPL